MFYFIFIKASVTHCQRSAFSNEISANRWSIVTLYPFSISRQKISRRPLSFGSKFVSYGIHGSSDTGKTGKRFHSFDCKVNWNDFSRRNRNLRKSKSSECLLRLMFLHLSSICLDFASPESLFLNYNPVICFARKPVCIVLQTRHEWYTQLSEIRCNCHRWNSMPSRSQWHLCRWQMRGVFYNLCSGVPLSSAPCVPVRIHLPYLSGSSTPLYSCFFRSFFTLVLAWFTRIIFSFKTIPCFGPKVE